MSSCCVGDGQEWFPAVGGAVVYGHPSACRRCANLTYKSSRSDAFTRACDKNHGLRRQLGWADGEWEPPKPKGMHWDTWERRIAECREAEEAMLRAYRALPPLWLRTSTAGKEQDVTASERYQWYSPYPSSRENRARSAVGITVLVALACCPLEHLLPAAANPL